jgi:hypothetical protein
MASLGKDTGGGCRVGGVEIKLISIMAEKDLERRVSKLNTFFNLVR